MSCNIGTSPINVSETSNTCDITCHYSYNYGLSGLTVTNNVDHLQLSYDSNANTITYNNTNYRVQEVRLYKPSLNQYNGTHMDAEMIIHHVGDGADNLLVCVPIRGDDAQSKSQILFKNIIPFCPPQNESTAINVSNYTLNNIIPKGGYYSYVGSLPYQPCNGKYNIVLFDPSIASNMRNEDLRTLGSLINPLNPKMKSIDKQELYYNVKGTSETDAFSGDDIYIKCSALDEEGNEIYTDEKKQGMLGERSPLDSAGSEYSPSKKREEELMKYIQTGGEVLAGIVLMYGLYIVVKKIVNKLSEE
jgi:carbonic anhydrase